MSLYIYSRRAMRYKSERPTQLIRIYRSIHMCLLQLHAPHQIDKDCTYLKQKLVL